MSSLHTEREAPEDYQNMLRRHDAEPDREISLNTSTILLIFFALALVCSAFFGFGYTMGRKSTPPTTYASSEDHTQSLRDAFKSFKPSPAAAPADKSATPAAKAETPTNPDTPASVVVPTSAAVVLPPHNPKPIFDPDAQIVTESSPVAKSGPAPHATPAVPTSAPAGSGTVIVQVAAVSHQEDADTMLAALKRKGYSVAIHQEPQDKLLHLQLGPYASKKDAEAMRARLLADGYNSILK